MSKIICASYSLSDVPVASLISISTSFQAALTPWLSTTIANDDRHWFFSELNLLALSPTFQFTRDLSCYADRELLQSDLFSPLYSNVKSLHLEVKRQFDFGVETANLVLRFQRLQKFELNIDDILTADPDSVIHVIETLLAKQTHFSNNFIVNFVKSTLQPWFEEILDAINNKDPQIYLPLHPIITLLKDKNIALLLQERMLDLYRQDHGESLIVFFNALELLTRVFFSIAHTLDEMSPTLDLIEQIVMNGDLLRTSKHAEPLLFNNEDQSTNEEIQSSKRWRFTLEVINLISSFIDKVSSPRDFMRRYGRSMLPQIIEFIMQNFDHSYAAGCTLDEICGCFMAVADDFFWFDEIDDETPGIEEIEKMVKNGRGLLAHMPFDEMAFMLGQTCEHLLNSTFAGSLNIDSCIGHLRRYVTDIEASLVLSRSEKMLKRVDFIEDLVARFNNKNILLNTFNCLEKNFEPSSVSEEMNLRAGQRQELQFFNELISCSDFLTPSEGKFELEYDKTYCFVDGNRRAFFKGDSERNNYCTARRVLEYGKKAMSFVEKSTGAYSQLIISLLPDMNWSEEIFERERVLCAFADENMHYVWEVERLLWIALRHLHESMKDAESSEISGYAKKTMLFVEIRKTARRATETGVEARDIVAMGRKVREERKQKSFEDARKVNDDE